MAVKALPPKGLYGYYSTGEEWIKVSVDADGKIQITSTDLATILSEVQNATYGLEAIKDAVDLVGAPDLSSITDRLDHATYGLSALETLVDGLETAVGANTDEADMVDTLFAGQQGLYHSVHHHYAMIVADKSSLTADETEILTNFTKAHDVYIVDEDDVDSGNFDFDIVAGIFVSVSCTDMTKLNELTTVAVPIVTDNPEVALTILRMGDDTGGSGTSWGTSATQTQINIVDNTHEITLTLSTGNLTIYSVAQTINWLRASDLVGGGIELAEVAGDNTKTTIAILPYDVDDEDGTAAPAIRVFVGGLTNHADLNTAGNTIFHDTEMWIMHQGIREIEVQGLGKINQILQKLGGELSNADNLYDYIVTGANEAGSHAAITPSKTGSVLERIEYINDLLEDGTYGLAALETLVDQVEGYTDLIDDATNGLAAIKAEVEGLAGAAMRGTESAALASSLTTHDTDIKADQDRHLTPLDFWGDPIASVAISTSTAAKSLGTIIVPTLPTGATIWKVQLIGFISNIVDSSGSDNAINGAVNIQVQDDGGGSWINAYDIQDNAFAVDQSEGPSRGGVPILGNLNNDDLSGAGYVDGADTYNVQITTVVSDGDSLTLYDLQFALRVWIY